MFFYVTDGYAVYPQFIDEVDHIVSKPYITRVEGENPRLSHYLARLQTGVLPAFYLNLLRGTSLYLIYDLLFSLALAY